MRAWNLASVWKAPVIFICENNLYALFTPNIETTSVRDIADRAKGYGFPGWWWTGMTPSPCLRRPGRRFSGPVRARPDLYRVQDLPDARAHRHGPLSPGGYRPKEEVDEWERKDPVIRLRTRLLEMKAASERA